MSELKAIKLLIPNEATNAKSAVSASLWHVYGTEPVRVSTAKKQLTGALLD
jgi:hypothetical protein